MLTAAAKLWGFPEARVAKAIRTALLEEVGTTPKPGLVDQWDNGAHKDMDFSTFLSSTEAVAPYLVDMARAGFCWDGRLPELFPVVKSVGVKAEKAMLKATGGVNTHKGAVFSLGILATVAGYHLRRSQTVDGETLLLTAGEMTNQTMEEEFRRMKEREPKSYGEKLFHQYGEKGIRGEVQTGFPSVRLVSLPLLRKCRAGGLDGNKTNINVLLSLMSVVSDTNILHRSSRAELAQVQTRAAEILSLGGAFTKEGFQAVRDWNLEMIEKNISPGGCADLLAVTIFCALLEAPDTGKEVVAFG